MLVGSVVVLLIWLIVDSIVELNVVLEGVDGFFESEEWCSFGR